MVNPAIKVAATVCSDGVEDDSAEHPDPEDGGMGSAPVDAPPPPPSYSGGFAYPVPARNLLEWEKNAENSGSVADYTYRYYHPKTGRWPSRDPIEESGGVNFYAMCYNSPGTYYDYLGRDPRPVNGGASNDNGFNDSQNNLFQDVADKGAGGSSKGKKTPSGDDLLNYFKELSKDNCCIKKITIAGHGWHGPADGPGLPGKADGSGFYEDGAAGDRWATDPSSARISDLENDIKKGDTKNLSVNKT